MGRSVLNNEVEKSLIKLCKGYEYEELKTIVEEDKNGKKRTKLEKNKRYQPPSAAALHFICVTAVLRIGQTKKNWCWIPVRIRKPESRSF